MPRRYGSIEFPRYQRSESRAWRLRGMKRNARGLDSRMDGSKRHVLLCGTAKNENCCEGNSRPSCVCVKRSPGRGFRWWTTGIGASAQGLAQRRPYTRMPARLVLSTMTYLNIVPDSVGVFHLEEILQLKFMLSHHCKQCNPCSSTWESACTGQLFICF